MYDLAIIGGGVAGMTAAVYAARAGMTAVIIEKGGFGGQAALTSVIENYPSYKEIEGFQLAANMKEQVDALGVESISADVAGLSKSGSVFTVAASTGDIEARTVIIANGVRRRELGIPGEDELRGRGISWCAVCDGGFFRRERPTAMRSYLDKLAEHDNIKLLPRHIPLEIKGERRVSALSVKNLVTDEEYDLEVSGVFEAIGLIPDNGMFSDLVELDANGYIVTDDGMRTRTEGLFAAGDTRRKSLRQIITACADGAIAATSAHEYITL